MNKAIQCRVARKALAGVFRGAVLSFPALVALILSFSSISLSAPPELLEYPPTFRNFKASYAKVWNAAVRLVVEDMGFALQAADPELGFLSTRWKIEKGKGNKPDRRLKLHINVKKSPDGALVTARCEIEKFISVKGTSAGRWMQIPSDHSCEARFLDLLASKLK